MDILTFHNQEEIVQGSIG